MGKFGINRTRIIETRESNTHVNVFCMSIGNCQYMFYTATYILKVSRAFSKIVLFLGNGLYLGNSTINKTISDI